ncbi:MAG TPA: S26 family signal peptidase [Methanocella sp.]|nr:S26 family signal peptidase [Methanocella sp.]
MDWRSLKDFFNSRFWGEALKDVVFAAGVVIVLVAALFSYAGIWPPFVTVDGQSMLPNMRQNDLVIIKASAKADVNTYDGSLSDGYRMFNDYGDVIVYRPLGDATRTPVIHRAMYYVKEGEPMWPGGPVAPHDGYITQGDNNFLYDQSSAISQNQPVKPEWIIGVAEARVPYLGWLRSVAG